MKKMILMLAAGVTGLLGAQTNIISTHSIAGQVMMGKYNPASYLPAAIIDHPDSIAYDLNREVSPDSLKSYLIALSQFKNRNTGSDTISNVKGIGASRRWIYNKFQQFSQQSQGRLLPSYLQFDLAVCNINTHRNVMAVLPGSDTSDKSIILIEAHMDSRCKGLCDTACLAEGMEDNGSGTALVIELARVMSKFHLKRTVVFMPVTGEEQGLVGANAFATYAQQNNIKIHAVLNNDVIGGIICGKTSSPPGCPGAGAIDSTHVRLFSFGGFNSAHKQFARFTKLEYKEMIRPLATVPMTVHIMTPEDRSGRGGDHIPFRQKGYTAIRFTAANEHGDADVSGFNYTDRQHTSADILGVDTDADQQLDSFFVDFRYLSRNTVLNGISAAMAAMGPMIPDFTHTVSQFPDPHLLTVQVTKEAQYQVYRLGLRTTTNDWDSVYTFSSGSTFTMNFPGTSGIISISAVDTAMIESLFSKEVNIYVTGVGTSEHAANGIRLLSNSPNPFDEATTISVQLDKPIRYKTSSIEIRDGKGLLLEDMPISLIQGVNEVEFRHNYHQAGIYQMCLKIDGQIINCQKIVFLGNRQ